MYEPIFLKMNYHTDGKPYKINITASYGLNIQLLPPSRKPRFYSNFMSIGESESFAEGLKMALDTFPEIPKAKADLSSRFYFQIVGGNDNCVRIALKSRLNGRICNARLTLRECEILIQDIMKKIMAIKASEVGECCLCGNIIHLDNDRYALKDHRLVHGRCMEHFITSEICVGNYLPAQKIPPTDCFGFTRSYGYRYYNART